MLPNHQIKKGHDQREFSVIQRVNYNRPYRDPRKRSNSNPATLLMVNFVYHIRTGEPFFNSEDLAFKSIIDQIRNEPNDTTRLALKKQLPCVSLSQICDPEDRKKTRSYSQLLQIDIDIKDNQSVFASEEKLRAIYSKLKTDEHIVLACKSPSNALKCVIHYDTTKQKIVDAHNTAASYFFDVYGLSIDKSVKDVTRLFFATYDPEAYYNKDAKVLQYITPEKPAVLPIKEPTISEQGSFDIDYIIEQIEGRNLDITQDYATWLNCGFALACEYGEAGRNYYHAISKNYHKYTHTETDAKYNECLKNHNGSITIATFLEACRKNNIHIRRLQSSVLTRITKTVKEPKNIDITHGTFWSLQDGKPAKINAQLLFRWLHDKYKLKYVKITAGETVEKPAPLVLTESKNNILKAISISEVRNYIGQHIKTIKDAAEREQVENAILKDINKIVTDASLQTYFEHVELKTNYDTANSMFFAFKNGIVEVTANDITLKNYKDIEGVFWENEVNKHSYVVKKDAANNSYADLISKITMNADLQESPENYNWLRWLIGYSLHRREQLQGDEKRMVILTENNIDPDTANGGTMKNTVFKGLGYLRPTITAGGAVFNSHSTFSFQTCNINTHLFAISDPKHFEIEHMFDPITEGVWVEKKNKQPFRVYARFWGLFNTMVKGGGDSAIRRMYVCVVSQFFNSGNLGRDYYKKELYTDFDTSEWNSFYTFLFECCQLYLCSKGKPPVHSPEGFLENKIELNTSSLFARFCEDYGSFENTGLWQHLEDATYLVTLQHFAEFYNLVLQNKYGKPNSESKNTVNRWFEVYLKAKGCKVRKIKKRAHGSNSPQWCFVVTP